VEERNPLFSNPQRLLVFAIISDRKNKKKTNKKTKKKNKKKKE